MIDRLTGMSFPKQLLYLVLVCFGCTLIGNVVSMVIIALLYGKEAIQEMAFATVNSPVELINALKIFLVFGNTLAIFLVPAIFFAYLIVRQPTEYLRVGTRYPLQLILIALALILALTPLMEWMILINQKLVLPDFLKGVEDWMRESENNAQEKVKAILKMGTIGAFISTFIIVAVLPALAEEFMFRGCLQTIFSRWTNNYHIGIWITAFLFSAIHMQFFGFLPRLILGALFGYMVVWGGSIWPSVWAHLTFNGLTVIAFYLYQHKLTTIDPDNERLFNNYPVYAFSLIIVLFLLWVYKRVGSSQKQPL